ncbi:MAG: glycosyltransferase family 39 protein [Agarilytica sp.]
MPKSSPFLFNFVGRSESSTKNFLIAWLSLIALYRILVTAQQHMGLFFDEAYYFHWAQLLDWGYYSKPPMVAWCIAVTTQLFGATDVSVKLASPILYSLSAWVVFLIGRKLDDERTGLIAALIFSTAPIVGFNSLFITTDAPLFFFWALAMYVALLCLEQNKMWQWLLLGFCLGCGMLSKYTYAAVVLGFLAYLLWTRRFDVFRNLGFYVATGLSLLIASTNLLWNWQHDFIAFTHTKEIAKLDEDLVKPIALLSFLLTQAFVIGVFWVVYALIKRKQWSQRIPNADAVKFLVSCMSPILVVIGTQAFLSRAFPNWAGAFVIPASVLLAFVVKYASNRTIYLGLASNLVLLSLFYHWPNVLSLSGVAETKKNSPYFRLSGWQEAALQGEDTIAGMKEAIAPVAVMSNSRDLLAYVGFYNRIHANDLYYWNSNTENIRNHYDLKNNARDLISQSETSAGKAGNILFLRKDEMPGAIQDSFEYVKLEQFVDYQVSPSIKRHYYIYSVQGFKGYPDDNEKN